MEIGRSLSSSSALWRNAGMEFNQPFLQLPWRFDSQLLAREVEALPTDFWLDHPSGLPGNSAVPLVSVNGEMNHAFDGAMQATRAHFAKVLIFTRPLRHLERSWRDRGLCA